MILFWLLIVKQRIMLVLSNNYVDVVVFNTLELHCTAQTYIHPLFTPFLNNTSKLHKLIHCHHCIGDCTFILIASQFKRVLYQTVK